MISKQNKIELVTLPDLLKRDFKDLVDDKFKDSQLNKDIGKHFDALGLANTASQSQRIVSLVRNIRNRASTILCAPTMTGKTLLMQISEMIENSEKEEKDKTEVIKLYPKSCSSLEEMLGRLDSEGNWTDGVLTRCGHQLNQIIFTFST